MCCVPQPQLQDLIVTGDANIGDLTTGTVSVNGVALQESSLILTGNAILPANFPSSSVVIFESPSLGAVLQLPPGASLQPGYRIQVVSTVPAFTYVQLDAKDTLTTETGGVITSTGNVVTIPAVNPRSFYYVGYNIWWCGNA